MNEEEVRRTHREYLEALRRQRTAENEAMQCKRAWQHAKAAYEKREQERMKA